MDPTIEEALRAKEKAEKLFAIKDYTGAKQCALRAQKLCPQLEGITHMVATFEIFAIDHSNVSSVYGTSGVSASDNSSKTPSSNRLDTFWTVCTSCRVQYEYYRKYVNKRLSCKNCRGVFVAVETGAAPVTYVPWSSTSENGYANHSYNADTYVPSTSVCFTGNGSSAINSTHGYEYASTMAFQWNASTGSAVDPNGLPSQSVNFNRAKANGKQQTRLNTGIGKIPAPRIGRPPKKQKIEMEDTQRYAYEELGLRTEPELVVTNLNKNVNSDIPTRQYCVAPAFDARKLLIDKARSVIRCKLKEMKLASSLKDEKNVKTLKRSSSMSITVPDPDFHDFDVDRSEEVFKPRQIWAIYDEDDGMPRLYCLIRQVISLKPFKLHITYLNSINDTEFGSVKWIESGFTKSCGSFSVSHSDIIDQVNIFSHLLGREKAGKVGCVSIYPKRGDIWAVYRNWSEKWNRKTSRQVRQQYEMVEVLDDYSKKLGVCVTPLVKLEGYKTVYQRNPNKNAIRWIPRKEMLRFSHQVPACMLKGQALNLPDGCWDLDPAATPEQLLHTAMEVE